MARNDGFALLLEEFSVSKKIGIRPWVDFAFRKIFGKPSNEICLISLLNSVLDLPHPIQSVQF